MTGRQGRRRKNLLDDLTERTGYSNLKEEALDRTMWRARFGRAFGPVVRQTAKGMTIFLSGATFSLQSQEPKNNLNIHPPPTYVEHDISFFILPSSNQQLIHSLSCTKSRLLTSTPTRFRDRRPHLQGVPSQMFQNIVRNVCPTLCKILRKY